MRQQLTPEPAGKEGEVLADGHRLPHTCPREHQPHAGLIETDPAVGPKSPPTRARTHGWDPPALDRHDPPRRTPGCSCVRTAEGQGVRSERGRNVGPATSRTPCKGSALVGTPLDCSRDPMELAFRRNRQAQLGRLPLLRSTASSTGTRSHDGDLRRAGAFRCRQSVVLPSTRPQNVINPRSTRGCSSAGRAPALQFACDMRCAKRRFPWSLRTVGGAVMCSN